MTRVLPMRFARSDLAERVVDLVRARVEEVLALEVDPRAAERVREAPRLGQRRRPAGVGPQEARRARARNDGVAPRLLVRLRELVERRHERLGHEAPAERAEAPAARRPPAGGTAESGTAHLPHERGDLRRVLDAGRRLDAATRRRRRPAGRGERPRRRSPGCRPPARTSGARPVDAVEDAPVERPPRASARDRRTDVSKWSAAPARRRHVREVVAADADRVPERKDEEKIF